MKTFTIVYVKTVKADQVVQAKNQKEAEKVFREANPDVRVVDVQDWVSDFDRVGY